MCKSENDDLNRFCEQCGQPLQRWYVLCLPLDASAVGEEDSAYLDLNNRYQKIQELDRIKPSDPRTYIALDQQPTMTSPLQALQTAWLENPDLDPVCHPLASTVPVQAFPYLALQAQYFPAIPELHDVLQINQQVILLLEDRLFWPALENVWPSGGQDPLQQTQWLFELTLLWTALTPWQAQATLLNPHWVRVSDHNLLGLTQLDPRPQPEVTLQTLGQVWQPILLRPEKALAPALQSIVEALAGGNLTQIEQLQAELAKAANEYRSVNPARVPSSALDPEPNLFKAEPSQAEAFPDPASLLTEDELMRLAEAQAVLTERDDNLGLVESPTMVLPMKLAQFDESSQSHVGQQRNHNEDCFLAQTQLSKVNGPHGVSLQAKGLYILCDGMGGHASGEVASQLAVQTLQQYFDQHWGEVLPDSTTLKEAVIAANQVIFDLNQTNSTSGVGRMGTTLVMVLIHNLEAAIVHVGDSRLYSYSKRLGLRQITLDHEVGQREIDRGVEPAIAYARPDAYQLTQALGPRGKQELSPSVAYYEITEDTLFILCSDGLSDNNLLERYETSHIAPLLSARANLDHGLNQLIDLANEKNGHDNITAVVARLKLQPDMGQIS
ncbi:MAG: serine/threonine phosphatase [Leptolyngbyaceae cyanobacterium SM2_3_12]|nr:serine/threonine phosphatase [Leptolyngbyaceae cyanobacterium SM2_3_12]